MSQYKKTIVLGLDYSEFSGGIAEANRKMNLLESEFKLATEEAKSFGDETDQLRLKQQALTGKVQLQQKVVQESKKAMESAATSQSATAKQVDNLKKKYIDQQTALAKMENELEKTEDQLKDTEKSQKTFGDTIRKVTGYIGMDANPIIQSFAEKFDNVEEKTGKSIAAIGILSGITSALAGKMVAASKEVATYADSVLRLADVTGLSTDKIQEMEYASRFLNVSQDAMTASMSKMVEVTSQARDGNQDMQKALARLGVRYKDANKELRSAEDVYYDVIDALGKMKNSTERDAAAMKIFGESAQQLNPLIKAGSQSLKDMGKEAQELGIILTSDELKKAGVLDDTLKKLDASSLALKNNLGLVLIPVLTGFFTAISKIPIPVLTTVISVISALVGLVAVVKMVMTVTKTIDNINSTFGKFNVEGMKTTAIIIGIVAAAMALAAIIAVIMNKKNDLNETFNMVGNNVNQMTKQISGAQSSAPKYNASGTNNFEGGETWVGEHGAERVVLPRGSKIIPAEQSGGAVYNTYNISIPARDIKEFNDIARIVQGRQVAIRRGAAPT